MMHLLKIEWLKLRKYRGFLILLGFSILGVTGINYIVYSVNDVVQSAAGVDPGTAAVGKAIVGTPFSFPDVWHTVTYVSSFLLVIPGILLILLMANEFTFRTHRQNVIDGLGRTGFITGKLLLMAVLAMGVTLLVLLTALLFGMFGGTPFSTDKMQYVGFFFIQSLSYMSVALILVMLFRRAGVAIGVYFLYAYIVENLLSLLINRHIVSGGGNFLPLKSADKLIEMPTMLGKLINQNPPDVTWMLVASLVWIVLMVWFCKWRFERSDL